MYIAGLQPALPRGGLSPRDAVPGWVVKGFQPLGSWFDIEIVSE